MNLYIVRHGETTWNSENRIQGHSDPGLSKLGHTQAMLLARRFKNIKIDRIYASPLLRTMQTALPVSKTKRLRIIKRECLKEVMLGDWEGMTTDEVDRLYRNSYQRWLKCGPTKITIPGAENIESFRRRVKNEFLNIIKTNKNKNCLVVTHGGVIAAFLSYLLKADFNKVILGLHLPNTCVTLVSFYNKQGCLIHVADTVHLSSKNEPKI